MVGPAVVAVPGPVDWAGAGSEEGPELGSETKEAPGPCLGTASVVSVSVFPPGEGADPVFGLVPVEGAEGPGLPPELGPSSVPELSDG